MQFGYLKHIVDTNLIGFVFQDCVHDNGSNSDSLDNAISIQVHIAWKDYLIRVECGPIQSHVLGGSRTHDPLTHTLRMCFISHYKCIVVIILHILRCFRSLFFVL